MVASVVNGDLDVHDRVSGEHARFHGFPNALVRRLDVFLGHGTTLGVVDELVALAGRIGLDNELDVTVLTAAAGLADKLAFAFDATTDGFAVGHHGFADVGFHFELAHHAVHDDLQVEFTHASDDGLIRLGISLDLEGGVFLSQAAQCDAHLLLVDFGFGLDGHLDHGIREIHALKHHGFVFVTDGLTCEYILEAHRRSDVTGADFSDVLALVGVHLKQATNALATILVGIVDTGSRFKHTGINADEGKAANKWIRHDLEDQGTEGFLVVRVTLDGVAVHVHALDGGDVKGAGHVVHHSVEHGLHALVLEGAAAHHRRENDRDAALADAFTKLRLAKIFAAQVFFHQHFIGLGDHLHHFFAPFDGGLQKLGRNLAFDDFVTLVAFVEGKGLHGHQVHNAPKVLLGANGDLDGHGTRLQTRLHHLHHAEEIRARAIHLVDESHARHVVFIRLTPDRLGLGFHATHGAEHRAGAVQHTQGTLHLGGEINVPRCVDDVDAVLDARILARQRNPGGGNGRGRNGDTTFLLLHHPVGGGSAIVNFADLVDLAGIKKNALRRGRFTGINVSHDADVAVALKGRMASHGSLLGRI